METDMAGQRKRITSITSAERDRFGEWVERWTAIGLSTAEADRDLFERAARRCYRFADLTEPRAIVWVESPLVACIAGPLAAIEIAVRRGSAVDSAVDSAVR
jgi:hypothetical protein